MVLKDGTKHQDLVVLCLANLISMFHDDKLREKPFEITKALILALSKVRAQSNSGI